MSEASFRKALFAPEAPVPQGLLDPKGRPAGQRFDVYRNNVTLSLLRALEAHFPALRQALGAEYFADLARDFLRAHPPQSPILMLYGAALPAFLAARTELKPYPYLPDLARLEQARRESYHAADAAPLDAARLAGLGIAGLLRARLRLAPALRLLRSDWPLYTIWQMNTEGPPGPLPDRAEAVLITRPQFDPALHPLTPAQADVVEALINGESLEAAAARAAPSRSEDLTALLSLLIGQGALVEAEVD